MPTANPEITVIVATYNQEDTIARTLESILGQQCPMPYEILIADDCSTDGTSGICRDYADRYPDKIRHIRRQHNLGLVQNYFTAIQQARGQFIADCAGDDFWIYPYKLSRQYDILINNPGITLVHTAWQYYNPATDATTPYNAATGAYARYFRPEVPGNELILIIIAHHVKPLVHLCTAMYRRDTITKAMAEYPQLFQSPWLTCEDLQTTVVLAAAGNFAYIPTPTLNYTYTPDTASQPRQPDKAFHFHHGIIRLTNCLQQLYGIPPKYMRPFYRRTLALMAKLMFNSRRPQFRLQTKQLIRLCRITPSPATALYLAATHNNAVWNATWHMKQLIKHALKK